MLTSSTILTFFWNDLIYFLQMSGFHDGSHQGEGAQGEGAQGGGANPPVVGPPPLGPPPLGPPPLGPPPMGAYDPYLHEEMAVHDDRHCSQSKAVRMFEFNKRKVT